MEYKVCKGIIIVINNYGVAPCGPGSPTLSPYPFTSPSFAVLYFSFFHFLIRFIYFLMFYIPSLSTGIVPLHFLAGGHRKRPNLGLFFCVDFVLSVLFS